MKQQILLEMIIKDPHKFASNKGNKLPYFKEFFKNKSTGDFQVLLSDKIKNKHFGNKTFDCVLSHSNGNIHAIEYKTMGSSIQKNLNNRKEEMLGQAFHARLLNIQDFSYIWIFNLSDPKEKKARKGIEQIYNVGLRIKKDGYLKNNIMLIYDNGKMSFLGHDNFENFKL